MAGKKRLTARDDIPRLPRQAEESPEEALAFYLRLLRPDTDPYLLARRLLERFDRLSDVFNAPPEVLLHVQGVEPRIAGALSALPDLARLYEREKRNHRLRLFNTQSAFEAVCGRFAAARREILVLQVLDSKGYLQYMGIVGEGSTDKVPLLIPEIVQLCLLYDADTVFLSHNHPSGNVMPSHEDIVATREVVLALAGIHVNLFDHFIFGGDDFFSMLDGGLLKPIKDEVYAFRRELLE